MGDDLGYDDPTVGIGVVLYKRGRDETVLEAMVVVEVVTLTLPCECSVGGVMRGLGDERGWFGSI